ncbi:galactoside alpha-(1,2)-fucosyltransferase 2-like [Cloeon dipterum]|uniref:galactoside alpha-(1,2)-fucosyltransferase 2-like n=1 Tax=Cloeon dipterum TaxID=197152 RepID=UPI00321FBF7A
MYFSKIQCAFLSTLIVSITTYITLVNFGCTIDKCNIFSKWMINDEPDTTESSQIASSESNTVTSGSTEQQTTEGTTMVSTSTWTFSSSTNSDESKTATTIKLSTKSSSSSMASTTPNKNQLGSTSIATSSTTKATSKSPPATSTIRPFNIRENNRWWTCPEPGKGRDSIIMSALVDGRLGNVVWSYLSVLLTAQLYGLRPVLHNTTIGFLVRNAFDIDHIRMPTLEWLDQKCNMSGWLDKAVRNENMSKTFRSRDDLYQALEKPPKNGLEMYRYVFFVTTTELLIPHFYELKKELILKKNNTVTAQKHLHDVKNSYKQHLKNRGFSRSDFEYVGVHVRRTDYLHHMDAIFHFGKVATPKFFHTAMDWLIKELSTPLVFVVVSDDRDWTKANIVANRTDVYLGGDGDISNPGIDLAILAACNHTIFAYGTFGLTGAFLASRPGGYTIIFDPENGTITKEMEFASNLPGWRIMTEDGKVTYRQNHISYAFYLHSPAKIGEDSR